MLRLGGVFCDVYRQDVIEKQEERAVLVFLKNLLPLTMVHENCQDICCVFVGASVW